MAGSLECFTIEESAVRLRTALGDTRPEQASLRILEAGCGPQWDLGHLRRPSHLTGLDIDEVAIQRRLHEVGDLDAAVWGDILDSSAFSEDSFDVIYSAYVLEHIEHAELALENLSRWLCLGGRVVLRLPDPASVYGWLARTTPHRAHVWYYRWFHRDRLAGRPGHSPYPTHYSEVLTRHGMTKAATSLGLVLVDVHGETAFAKRGFKQSTVRLVTRLIRGLSLGRLERDHENLCWVFEKA